MNSRRAFLRHGGLAAVVLPVAGARAVLEVGKEPPPQLAHVQTGGLLTAEWMNSMVERVAELEAEIERLRAAGNALAEALHGWCNGMDAFTDDAERVRAWKEARRG